MNSFLDQIEQKYGGKKKKDDYDIDDEEFEKL